MKSFFIKLFIIAAIALLHSNVTQAQFSYLVGSFNDWNTSTGLILAPVATLEVTGNTDNEFKVFSPNYIFPSGFVGDQWFGGLDLNGVGYFLITDELLARPIQLYGDNRDEWGGYIGYGGSNFKIQNPGKYMITLSYNIIILNKIGEIKGDLNNDGLVDVEDVNGGINIILKHNNVSDYPGNCDMDGNGIIDVEDINAMINIILGLDNPEENEEVFDVNGVKFKMVNVKGGTFTMGASNEDSDAFPWEKPSHQVTLSSYSIGQTEVTQALWLAVMGSNPSGFTNDGNLQKPVEKVSWDECQEFITKLNQMTGKTFRLPTEAEWEYAARGGNKSMSYKFAGSNTADDVAWYKDNSSSTTHTIASKTPNELGLYDMSGNVWEWCYDWYEEYANDAQTNPTGPASGTSRTCRGGCWLYAKDNCRLTYRASFNPTQKYTYIGLRLAM